VGTYTILVDAASAAKDIGKVESLFDETKRKNVVGDFYFYTAVINALIDGYCRKGMVDNALEIKATMEKIGIDLDNSVTTWSIYMLLCNVT